MSSKFAHRVYDHRSQLRIPQLNDTDEIRSPNSQPVNQPGIFALQPCVGNRNMQKLIQESRTPSSNVVTPPAVQRFNAIRQLGIVALQPYVGNRNMQRLIADSQASAFNAESQPTIQRCNCQNQDEEVVQRFWDEEEEADNGSWWNSATEDTGNTSGWISEQASDAGEWVSETIDKALDWLGGDDSESDQETGENGTPGTASAIGIDLDTGEALVDPGTQLCMSDPKCRKMIRQCAKKALKAIPSGTKSYFKTLYDCVLDSEAFDEAVPIFTEPKQAEKGIADVAKTIANEVVKAAPEKQGKQGGAACRKTLFQGCSGPLVAEAQQKLNDTGATPPLVVDGIFGPATQRAVAAFQQSQGLKADGVIGPQTKLALGLFS